MPFLQPNGLYLTGFDELVCQTDEERRLLLRHEQTDVRVSSLRSLCRSVHSLHITHQTLPGRHGAQVSFWSIRWGSEYQTCAMQRGSEYRASSLFVWSKRGPIFECHFNTGPLDHLNSGQMDAILFP